MKKQTAIIIGIVLVIFVGFGWWFISTKQVKKVAAPATQQMTSASPSEQTKTYTSPEEAAQKMTEASQTSEIPFQAAVKKRAGNFARLQAIATKQVLDPLTIILEYKNGVWVSLDYGTSFPDLEEKMPELFSD